MKRTGVIVLYLCVALAGISFLAVCAIMTIMGPDLFTASYYSDKSNYEELKCIVIEYNDSYYGKDYVLCNEERDYDGRFSMAEENIDIIRKSTFWDDINIGDYVYIKSAPRTFGDGWAKPVVAVRTETKTYLDFDKGVENQVRKSQEDGERCLQFLIPALSILVLSLITIIIILVRNYRIKIKSLN